MRKPNAMTYVVGNPASVALLCALTCYLVYEAWTGTGSGLLALLVALVTSAAMNAKSRLTKYGQWKREWNAMEGKAPSSWSVPVSGRGMRLLIAIPVWFEFAYFALMVSNDPIGRIGAGLFWLATMIGVIGSVIQWRRHHIMNNRPARSHSDAAVKLCLGIHTGRNDLGDCYNALPNYCLGLIDPARP